MNVLTEISSADKAQILIEALPYIQKFSGKIVVVKYGGSTISAEADRDGIDPVILDIIWLKQVGLLPVVVHGGGKAITKLLNRLGHQAQFVDGLRVTDEPTMEVVEMVLGGQVNKQLVAAFGAAGCAAVGLTGVDGNLLQVQKKHHASGDLGLVGEVTNVQTEVLQALLASGFIPVIAPIGVDEAGTRYNVNADSAAGAIAGALQAEKLILLTDVPGILKNGVVLSEVTAAQIDDLIADGTVSGGMVPKVEACLEALRYGARHVHILNGNERHALLLEVFTKNGIGTLVQGGEPTA
ncbi:acetylglutamate kinase [Tumebacillus permanentifrigoris]|uniref:Acetylglutamate kinase n=1 Tax=Tumebacillus permanentifrigoris TaxID=378543 RepID=A0A316D707_9BACL|nr:acetylglutamate kinase [Tumebacillus permanentifrigoris]PWK09575.1 N-acetylglutamate kinase [Tumebacillus permanentifrigoris]